MPPSKEEIVNLIHSDPKVSAMNSIFMKGLRTGSSKAASEIAQNVFHASSAPLGLGSVGTVISAGFRSVGMDKNTAQLTGSAGKFVLLSVAVGPVGMLLGATDLVFSIFAYIDREDEREKEKMRDEIVASMQQKMDDIVAKVEVRRQEVLKRDGANSSGDEKDRILHWIDGKIITVNDIAGTKNYLDGPNISGKDEDLILAKFYVEHKESIDVYRGNGNNHPTEASAERAAVERSKLVGQILKDRAGAVVIPKGSAEEVAQFSAAKPLLGDHGTNLDVPDDDEGYNDRLEVSPGEHGRQDERHDHQGPLDIIHKIHPKGL